MDDLKWSPDQIIDLIFENSFTQEEKNEIIWNLTNNSKIIDILATEDTK